MIDQLDNLLRHLLIDRLAEITDAAQVRFQPPDADWRTYVANLGRTAINVYLVDLRENLQLRSNERVRDLVNGVAVETPAPRRVDCQYLITAWSPAVVTPAIEPTVDEHALLYRTAAVLVNAAPLVPREVYAPNPTPPGLAALGPDRELPTVVLLSDGFPKYAEFWGTMGSIHPWRPAVTLVVTLPILPRSQELGRLVTTRIFELGPAGDDGPGDVWIQIGGRVLNTAALQPDGTPLPLAGVWVQLESEAGTPLRNTRSGLSGRFSFGGLQAGRYQLHAEAVGLGSKSIPVNVPSESGDYDVRYP